MLIVAQYSPSTNSWTDCEQPGKLIPFADGYYPMVDRCGACTTGPVHTIQTPTEAYEWWPGFRCVDYHGADEASTLYEFHTVSYDAAGLPVIGVAANLGSQWLNAPIVLLALPNFGNLISASGTPIPFDQ